MDLVNKIATNYQESFNFLQLRKRRQVAQLILLNNLRRGDQNIASTLLLTLFNRILSTLYDDKLQIKFLPSQGIQQEQLDAYNSLAQSDYMEMDKAKLDYDWVWDTLFFGRGYVETIRFDKKRKIMTPHVINPLVFGYDPYFEAVQDWRYYWKWVTKSKSELQKLIDANIITGVKRVEDIPSGVDAQLWDYKLRRDRAKEAIEPSSTSSDNDVFQILEYCGYDDDGDKAVFWVDKSFSKILFQDKLNLGDGDAIIAPNGDEIKVDSKWPIVMKEAFREPHSSVNFSVADLLEDKHRAKSVLLNLAYIAAKDRANPLYWYNDNVTDVTQFLSRQVNQHIKLNDNAIGDNSMGPINTEDPMSAGLIQFISILTTEANEPIGTGQAQQPQKDKGSDTATEAAIDQQLSDMAQSLQSKVLQFGEAEFWSHWFHRYAKNADSLGEKMANIVGVKGIDTQIIDLSVFNTKYPPGVMVYSAKEAEYKELVLRRDLMQLLPNLVQTLDPEGLRNFYKHVFFPKFLPDPSLVETMLPPSMDEMKAESENEQLKDGMMPDVLPTDKHETHIYIHMMLQPKTWATWTHVHWHQELLAQQTAQQQQQGGSQSGDSKVAESIGFKDLPPEGQVQMAAQAGINIGLPAPQTPTSGSNQGQNQGQAKGPAVKMGAQKKSPLAAAAPLKGAIQPQTVVK